MTSCQSSSRCQRVSNRPRPPRLLPYDERQAQFMYNENNGYSLNILLGCKTEQVLATRALVNKRKTTQVHEEVLLLGLLDTAPRATELVKPGDLVHDEVDERKHDGHSKAVQPDANDGDNVGVAVVWLVAGNPAEEGEDRGENIDGEDGADKLPTRPSAAATGYKDEPVLKDISDMRSLGRDWNAPQ